MVSVFDATRVVLTDAVVRGTLEYECASGTCAGMGFGSGVVTYEQAATSMERFRIEGCALCGVHATRTAEVDLRDGVIADNLIGACVDDGFDPVRLTDEVAYRDNETSLQASTLPVPDAGDPIMDP